MTPPLLSVQIVTWNHAPVIEACLASLAVEACDPDPGPVTAMNGCNSYCVK